MRLIDANALKETIKKELPAMSNWGEHFIPMLIDKAPTIEQEIYITGEASNLYIDGYREGMKDYKQLVAKIEELEKEKRPQGEWTDLSEGGIHTGWITCTNCGQEPPNESNYRSDFCPNCGARMGGKEE